MRPFEARWLETVLNSLNLFGRLANELTTRLHPDPERVSNREATVLRGDVRRGRFSCKLPDQRAQPTEFFMPIPSLRPRYRQGYAVIRIDNYEITSHVEQYTVDGESFPAPGPVNVNVKEAVFDAGEARNEVMRLNRLNKDRGCRYYWQSTHVFVDGGSHGSNFANEQQ